MTICNTNRVGRQGTQTGFGQVPPPQWARVVLPWTGSGQPTLFDHVLGQVSLPGFVQLSTTTTTRRMAFLVIGSESGLFGFDCEAAVFFQCLQFCRCQEDESTDPVTIPVCYWINIMRANWWITFRD